MHSRSVQLSVFVLLTVVPAMQADAQMATIDSSPIDLPKPSKEVAELMKLGDVKVQFYRQRPVEQQYDGQTSFRITIDYRYQLRTKNIQVREGLLVRANVTFTKITVKPEIKISLPSTYAHDDVWNSALMKHELEHLQIDVDPRAAALLRRAVASVKSIEAPRSMASPQTFKKLIAEAVDEKVANLTDLIQKNNDLFDEITQHGVRSEDRDPNFFARLYMEDNLKEQKYGDLKLVKTLLGTTRYRKFAKMSELQ